jgi:hypothetical protein
MPATLARLETLVRESLRLPVPVPVADRYRLDPVGYMRDVLRADPWHRQEEIARALLRRPWKVAAPASHSVGKTWLAAALVSWFFDTRPTDSCVITTAPTSRDVRDLLWREVRLQRARAGLGGFVGESNPELGDRVQHVAKGFTARRGESFQGRHFRHMMFVFDEAVGIDPQFWDTARTMFKAGGEHYWFAIFNPTVTDSQAYRETHSTELDGTPAWTVLPISSLDHPNLAAELCGQEPPYPAAVSRSQFEDWLGQWSEPIDRVDATDTDIQWPPGSGRWYRPGPLMQARALGRWPGDSVGTVWSPALWERVCQVRHEIQPQWPVQLGCDVARFGDDYTEIHARKGLCSVLHEAHNGWSTKRTADRLRELAWHLRGDLPAEEVPVVIEDDGIGGGVVDQDEGYNFIPLRVSSEAIEPDRYASMRSELWFASLEYARRGVIDVSRLDRATRQEIGRQLAGPRYSLDMRGRIVVEPKKDTKKRIKRSPDGADSFLLAWYPHVGALEGVS